MIGKHQIGRESQLIRKRIEEDAVRRFAEAVGIPFENQVPPTYVGIFIEGSIDGFELFRHGAIHGEQKFTYYQPVAVGDCIAYTRRITDVYERTGKLGTMTFVVVETLGRNPAGEPVFACSSTIIIRDGGAEDETPSRVSD